METRERVGRHATQRVVPPIRRARWRAARRAALAVLTVALVWLGWSIVPALTAPGTDSVSARLAEWGRLHHLGWLVTDLEKGQYSLHKPVVGGTVAGGIPTIAAANVRAGSTLPPQPSASAPAPLVPPVIVPPVAHPLPGEGRWQNLLMVNGTAAAAVASVRPDSVHTSYLVSLVWMNPALLRFTLHPGYHVPGGPLQAPDQLTSAERASVLATFNSGFQMGDANGGYWQNGTTITPLRTGAASQVLTTDGHLSVERWPGGMPGAGIAAVRQNLVPLIEGGRISPLVPNASTDAWGATLGNRTYVWRSAIGVRPDGSVVYVIGPAMDIQTLADIMHAAGVETAMELDINPDWTSFITYTHPVGGQVIPHKLTATEVASAYRYLQSSSRDFVAVFPR